MDMDNQNHFISQWRKYFSSAELPITYYYSNQVSDEDSGASQVVDRCLIANLRRVREGFPFVYEAKTQGCARGKRYSGFSQSLRPRFEYFLSCGIPGELEGERYKRDPDLVSQYLLQHPPFEAPASYLVFKRWDRLTENETPLAVVFFATGDVLSGLFALANYDMLEPDGVITPMGAGCASIIGYALEQAGAAHPRCVLGMFDVSVRPHVGKDELTFAIPFQRFIQLVNYMDESFLITSSWDKVRARLT
ncbi:MAG: hypothetical protein FIA98_08230 [Anaerolineae bacterium]|nr:hypothetical protein [Anaerolineae bacterium]